MRRAGAFHDVGKVEVPNEIINKPGPLSEEEFAIVKRHAVAGAQIVAVAATPACAAPSACGG